MYELETAWHAWRCPHRAWCRAWRRARRRAGQARVRRRSVDARLITPAASAARHHGRHARSTRTGEGTLPDRPARRQRGRPSASAADAAPDGQMVLCTGRHPAELHATRPQDWARSAATRPAPWPAGLRLAVNPEGVPLGILRAGFDAPRPAAKEAPGAGQSTAPKGEERKSFRWIEGRDCAQAEREQLPDTAGNPGPRGRAIRFVERRVPRCRRIAAVRSDCISRSARVKASKQARKQQRTARIMSSTPVQLWVVHAREQRPPAQVAPLQWFLLSTLPVASAADAIQVLQWYTLRIED